MKLKFTISHKNIGILAKLLTNLTTNVWKSGQQILFCFNNEKLYIYPKELGVEEIMSAQL